MPATGGTGTSDVVVVGAGVIGDFDRAQEPVEGFGEAAQARDVEVRIDEALGLEPDGAA